MHMPDAFGDEDMRFRYHLVDVRELDGEELLASDGLGDNLIAILARLRDHKEAVREIIRWIARLPSTAQGEALAELLTLAGLRQSLLSVVQQEVREMPIALDIMDHPILGPMFRETLEKRVQECLDKG